MHKYSKSKGRLCSLHGIVCLTGRIVAITSPDCQHKQGQRLCCLAICCTVVSLWVDKRLSALAPLQWFVRCWWEPSLSQAAQNCEELPSCVSAITPIMLGSQTILMLSSKTTNLWSKENSRKMGGTVLFPSSRRPGCTHSFKLWFKRGREDVGVDYSAGLQTDQLCIIWTICATLLQS